MLLMPLSLVFNGLVRKIRIPVDNKRGYASQNGVSVYYGRKKYQGLFKWAGERQMMREHGVWIIYKPVLILIAISLNLTALNPAVRFSVFKFYS
jgi:hypothetical protein